MSTHLPETRSPADADAAPLPLVFVLNAGAGAQTANEAVAQIERTMQAAGRSYRVLQAESGASLLSVLTRALDEARRLRGAVVAVGGDGTINSVAQAVLPAGLPMGMLPQGTFNYFAREHGMPLELEPALAALITARIQQVQVGEVNGRLFLVNASIGLYPRLLEEREEAEQKLGRGRGVSLLAMATSLLRPSAQRTLRLQCDDALPRLVRATTLFVGNNRPQLERLGVSEAQALGAGRLVALRVRTPGRGTLLRLALRGALGRLGESDEVESFAFERLSITPASAAWGARRPIKVALDGEVLLLTPPLLVRVRAAALSLLVPQAEPEQQSAERQSV